MVMEEAEEECSFGVFLGAFQMVRWQEGSGETGP